MFTLFVILVFLSILVGMAISVMAFGTGTKRAKIFDHIYYSIEDVDGMGVVYTRRGDYSAILTFRNPIAKYAADTDVFYDFTNMMDNIVKTLGEGFCIQKQDVFVRRKFDMNKVATRDGNAENRFLSDAYFRHFDGRFYVTCDTYLVITQEQKKSGLFSYDASKWREFMMKTRKVYDIFRSCNIEGARFLGCDEIREYADRFFAQDFSSARVSMTDFKVDAEEIGMGDRKVKVYSLLDVDQVGLPTVIRPYMDMIVNNSPMPVDIMGEIDSIPDATSIVYNQVIFIPPQQREKNALEKKKNRHASIPNPSNQVAVEDIVKVQNVIERENKMLVYAHYSLVVCMPVKADTQKVTNVIENILGRQSIHISRRAYNQLELFVGSFPGNSYKLNPEYDRYLTLSDAALCLLYKERQSTGDDTPLKCYYTDRQGVPMAIDITGKEGKKAYTTNANFFVLGPSGSGKSFFMNTVCRQLYEQDTDMVIVDTGDSYEGLNEYFGGTYITYSKERPISMNPFKVTEKEFSENFTEKKNFLMSLVILIFKGDEPPTKIESTIINQVIVEYYQEFFTPFKGYTSSERQDIHKRLLLEAKINGDYEKFQEELEKHNGGGVYNVTEEDRRRYERDLKVAEKLEDRILDDATTEGEKEAARNQLQRLTPAIIEGKFYQKIEEDIDKMEVQKRKMRVTELNFNSFYDFAMERIPQITRQDKVNFNIHEFKTILKPFYRGGEMEYTLNNDMDQSLFDERFIVFEIDKVKDDPILFPIIVLIIMDVFTQKMRIKKCRKCLVIEEAWKAIATPIMAEYIKYLYKTARKHWAMVGVVTQELQDVVSSPIVKEAIISNSDVFMLLDQAKFKDKFSDIRNTLALTDIDCRKIFTINRLDNKENRSPFKEVFIRRGSEGEVFGVEEPIECYMSYTTEKIEKEALKLYKRQLRCSHQAAITAFVRDYERSGSKKTLEFAQRVMREGRVLNLPPRKEY